MWIKELHIVKALEMHEVSSNTFPFHFAVNLIYKTYLLLSKCSIKCLVFFNLLNSIPKGY